MTLDLDDLEALHAGMERNSSLLLARDIVTELLRLARAGERAERMKDALESAEFALRKAAREADHYEVRHLGAMLRVWADNARAALQDGGDPNG